MSIENPADITGLQASIDALPVLTPVGGTITSDGTEQDVYINNAPASVFKPLVVLLDLTLSQAGETVDVREYYRLTDGGAWVEFDEDTFAGVQDPPGVKVALSPTEFGVRVTLERTAGVARVYPWFVAYEA